MKHSIATQKPQSHLLTNYKTYPKINMQSLNLSEKHHQIRIPTTNQENRVSTITKKKKIFYLPSSQTTKTDPDLQVQHKTSKEPHSLPQLQNKLFKNPPTKQSHKPLHFSFNKQFNHKKWKPPSQQVKSMQESFTTIKTQNTSTASVPIPKTHFKNHNKITNFSKNQQLQNPRNEKDSSRKRSKNSLEEHKQQWVRVRNPNWKTKNLCEDHHPPTVEENRQVERDAQWNCFCTLFLLIFFCLLCYHICLHFSYFILFIITTFIVGIWLCR